MLALADRRSRQVRATTSVELDRRAAVQLAAGAHVHATSPTIASIVDTLAPDGLHVERWFPKAGLAGRVVDLRVVVIAGRADPRRWCGPAAHPMTNLHLGGGRGDLAALRARGRRRRTRRRCETCVRVAAACFPGSLHVGVDLMFSPDWRRHAVAEVNAFGDLLPGLLVDGRDTYADAGRRPADPGRRRDDMNAVVGTHDLLFVTLDTLRYDVAAELAAAGRTPNLARVLPGGALGAAAHPGELHLRRAPRVLRRLPAHAGHARAAPAAVRGPVPRQRDRPAPAPGSSTRRTSSTGLAAAGYHTVCVGGVGFFNQRTPLGRVLPGPVRGEPLGRRRSA